MDYDTPVGESIFKLMIQKGIIDTRATDTHLRENLTKLNTYMYNFESYIEHFNQYVKVNVGGLKVRGERADDLMINLFKAYQVASDRKLVRYIKKKRYQYDDGYNISKDELMTSVLNRFEILRKDNKWNSMPHNKNRLLHLHMWLRN